MTLQDTRFNSAFADMTASVFYGSGQTDLGNYAPAQSPINTGMLADIGRVTVYGPEAYDNPYAKFMKAPLARGDSAMTARFSQVTSGAYNPLAPDTALFDGQRPSMLSNVATKNLSRQVRVEINDRLMKQFVQTQEMIGDAASAIVSMSHTRYLDDMFVASNEYFAGSTRGAKATQMITLTKAPTDNGFAEEMTEALWNISQNKFKFKSTLYNESQYDTKAESASIIMDKNTQFRTFKKQYADAFNPEYLDIATETGWVDSFPTVAGKPSGAGDLLAIVADNRAFEITPMPEALSVESFRNPVRKSTMYATTYEYAFSHNPFFNVAYVFAPSA